MVKEKLSEAKEYKVLLHYLQDGVYKPNCQQLMDNQKRAVRRKAKSFAIRDRVLYVLRGRSAINIIAVWTVLLV